MAVELTEQPLSRDGLTRIALYLHDIQGSASACELRRTLRECAARLEEAARSLPADPNATPFLRPEVADMARGLDASLGIGHRNAGRLLALLLVEPGTTISTRGLAASLGISHASVRVFAFHLRNWLAARGMAGALECRWGVGYAISASNARLLLQRSFHLQALVSVIRDKCGGPVAGQAPAFDFEAPAETADPFPIVRHRALEARVLA